jgi:para-aminobenzoate synthetase component 1
MLDAHLEEALGSPANARPAVLEGKWLGDDDKLTWTAVDPASVLEGSGDALEELPVWLARHAEQFPSGAALGFFSYELARCFERLPLYPDPSIPDFSFAYYPLVNTSPRRTSDMFETSRGGITDTRSGFDELHFSSKVERIRQYIVAGDIYQANLTEQISVQLDGQSPEAVYERLAPGDASFRAFFKGPYGTVISNSPERFFRVSGGRILTSPIKGTIARSDDPARDALLAGQLLASDKDRAENLMIVDLLRNDLGRICTYESIHARLWDIDPLPQLFHLVSHVEGTLRAEVGLLDILRALFPCGSITGAPKIRAMEILAGIEGRPRGISMGAIGIIRGVPGTDDFEMDFNVAIRTMLIRDDVAVFNVGGGIVYDSDPHAEFEEMLLKARPLLEALGPGAKDEVRTLETHTLQR